MENLTEAAVLYETSQPLRLCGLIVPEPGPGQVVVDIAYSGLCHTQLGEVRGRRGVDRFLPHTLGHEGTGTVVAVGEGVGKVRPGDPVVLSWLKGSGCDVAGMVYQSADGSGPVNSGAISTFMRRTVTCESRVTPIPAIVPLREAALFGCAVPTGCGIVGNDAGVKAGESVAVFGVGGIGLSAVLGCVMVGAAPIIAVDTNPGKLAKAGELGATHLIDAAAVDPLAEIERITEGRGVDYAIEAAGKTSVMETAFRAVRNFGGLCVVAGNPEPGEMIRLNPFDLIRGKRIIGSWGGGTDPDRDIPRYVEAFLANRLPLQALLTQTYPLARINDALDDLEAGRIVRALIDMAL